MENNIILFLFLYTFVFFFDYGFAWAPLKYRNCYKLKIPSLVKHILLLYFLVDKENKVVFSVIISRLFIYSCMVYCILEWIHINDNSMVSDLIRNTNTIVFAWIFNIHLLWYIVVVLVSNIKGNDLSKAREKQYLQYCIDELIYLLVLSSKRSYIKSDFIYIMYMISPKNGIIDVAKKVNNSFINMNLVKEDSIETMNHSLKISLRKLNLEYKRANREKIEMPTIILAKCKSDIAHMKVKKSEDEIRQRVEYKLVYENMKQEEYEGNIESFIERVNL